MLFKFAKTNYLETKKRRRSKNFFVGQEKGLDNNHELILLRIFAVHSRTLFCKLDHFLEKKILSKSKMVQLRQKSEYVH
jgi:hypothetical protein